MTQLHLARTFRRYAHFDEAEIRMAETLERRRSQIDLAPLPDEPMSRAAIRDRHDHTRRRRVDRRCCFQSDPHFRPKWIKP